MRSKTSANKKARADARLDRPFDRRVLAKAESIAASYQLVLTAEPDVGYFGRTVELPLVMADGPTLEACARATMEATIAAVATLLEANEPVPSPARLGKRDQQVNIRLTSDEKMRLEEAARREGYRSLSDFLRESGLGRAS